MKKFQILGFFITCFSLSILKISSKSETWSPEPFRPPMDHTIYTVQGWFSEKIKVVSLKQRKKKNSKIFKHFFYAYFVFEKFFSLFLNYPN